MADETKLADVFRRMISATGPISMAHFMAESNARYYASRDPFGHAGDFVTAPEISQMFGELIGLWLADMWIRAERPEPVHYVELGPGRGTLARDALRAMKSHGLEPRVHLVETSTALKDIQLAAVPNAIWHDDLSTVPMDGPLLVVANEFLDALPVRQLVKTEDGWREVMVTVEGGGFACVAGQQPMDSAVPEDRRDAEIGTLVETSPASAAVIYELAGRLVKQGGAALVIDYGHAEPRGGSTIQAVRAHEKLDPLEAPGEADISAHVDFSSMAPVAQSRGASWLGTVDQGDWLEALGIGMRAEALARSAPDQREALHAAHLRLAGKGEGQMGALFKVMGLASPDWPFGAGF